MSAYPVNYLLPTLPESTEPRTLIETIAYKKANDIALSCLECLVHCFLVLFSCCYPSYQHIYESEIVKKLENRRNKVEEVSRQSIPRSPEPQNAPSSVPLESLVIASPRTPQIPFVDPIAPSLKPPEPMSAPSTFPMLTDTTAGNIAELRPSEERDANGKPYQSLFLKSKETSEYHKVILYNPHRDGFLKTYLDLAEGDNVSVRDGLNGRIIIFVLRKKVVEAAYTMDLPPIPIDYKNPNGEKIYVTELTPAQFETGLKHDQRNREELSAVFPHLFAPIVANIEPGAKITAFQRNGKLHDFTEGAIVALKISDEPHAETEKPYEDLVVNGLRVILYKNPEIKTHFELQDDEDAVVVKNTQNGNGLLIEEHTGFLKQMQNRYVLNLKNVYQTTHVGTGGVDLEDVYIAGVSRDTLQNSEELRIKFSLAWPPRRR